MSVDYSANYGIGYKVGVSDEIADTEDLEGGLEEYIDCELGDEFECFATGSSDSWEIDGIYISIKDPFKDGLDLTEAKNRLDEEVKRLKLDVDGDFNEIGGLYVY